jgi:acyl-CoA synthetase (AMP-forming)/AMP-acid ligase II
MNRIFLPSGTLPATLVDTLRHGAEPQTERDALLSLRHRSIERPKTKRLTHRSFFARVQAVAGVLQWDCAKGDRALMLAPPGAGSHHGVFRLLRRAVLSDANIFRGHTNVQTDDPLFGRGSIERRLSQLGQR